MHICYFNYQYLYYLQKQWKTQDIESLPLSSFLLSFIQNFFKSQLLTFFPQKLYFKLILPSAMTDPQLFFASPFQSTPNESQKYNDSPIRLLQSSQTNFISIQAKKLFYESSTKVNKQKQGSSVQQKSIIEDLQKCDAELKQNVSNPLYSISNFSPYTVCESEERKSAKFCDQQKQKQPQFLTNGKQNKKRQEKESEKKRELAWGKIKFMQKRKQNEKIINQIKIHCHIKGPKGSEDQQNKQYLVPECESSFYSEQIPFHESRLTKNLSGYRSLQKKQCQKQKSGYHFALNQLKIMKENMERLRKVSKRLTSGYEDSSAIIQGQQKLQQSFLHEIRSGLIEILEHVEMEKQNNPQYAESERINIEQFSQISQDFIRSENPIEIFSHLPRQESLTFDERGSNPYFDSQQSDTSILKRENNQYVTPVHRRETFSQNNTRSPENMVFPSNNSQQSIDSKCEVISLTLNVDLNSSGQLIAKKAQKRKSLRQSEKIGCQQNSSISSFIIEEGVNSK